MKKALYWGLILLVAANSCQHKLDKKVDVFAPKYQSDEGSKLRFHNVRSLFYDIEENPNNKMKVMRMKGRQWINDKPQLWPVLVNNFLYDEAFVFLESTAWFSNPDSIVVFWEKPGTDLKGRYTYIKGGKDAYFTFCGQLHDGIIKGYSFRVSNQEGKNEELFPVGNNNREIFRKTMIDFYRLVNLD